MAKNIIDVPIGEVIDDETYIYVNVSGRFIQVPAKAFTDSIQGLTTDYIVTDDEAEEYLGL